MKMSGVEKILQEGATKKKKEEEEGETISIQQKVRAFVKVSFRI